MIKLNRMWAILTIICIITSISTIYINHRINRKWDKMYELLNKEPQKHPEIMMGSDKVIRFHN
jgi:hypothetical protein